MPEGCTTFLIDFVVVVFIISENSMEKNSYMVAQPTALCLLQIPEDIINEAGICALCDELSLYQQDFIELHKECERHKNDSRCALMILNI